MTNNLPKIRIPQRISSFKMLMVSLMLFLSSCRLSAPTALDVVPDFTFSGTLGVNLGYYPPYWSEEIQANEARKFGCTTLRTGLFHHVLEKWGYAPKAETLRYCKQIGFEDMVGILGFPSPEACDTIAYCGNGLPQTTFKGLYLPIWIQEGTESRINEENIFAHYVWKAATQFKGLIRVYEIWNEPDAGSGGANKGYPGNWWDTAPPPCQTGFKAPIFHYIRLLRIAHEVVKKVDPDALIAVGGLGWPSYLDAVCRYTDHPENGQKRPGEYPLTGGAYFDCMSFHAYPHLYALDKYDPGTGKHIPQRHSDAALEGLWQRKKALEGVLFHHGFDGIRFPQKRWICTEFNLPRKSVQDRFGSEAAQVNFVLKAVISSKWNGVNQMHLYSFADAVQEPSPDPEFGYMGLASPLDSLNPEKISPTGLAFAIQSLMKCLSGFTFDPDLTKELRIQGHLEGGVFSNPDGSAMLVIWLKTTEDLQENQAVKYLLPEEWDLTCSLMYTFKTDAWEQLKPYYREIPLTNTPVFIKICNSW